MQIFSIKPREPTILANCEFYDLLPTDLLLWLSPITVHVVPGLIDVERFNDALSRTLSLYPLAAGRIEKPSSSDLPWKIRLTNSPVPVTVVDSNETEIFPTNTIVQNPLRFVQSIEAKNVMKASPDEPLLRMTLTRFTSLGQSTIGLSSSHAIGDGFMILRFLRQLSQNYQCLDALDPAPCYQPLLNPALISRTSESTDTSLPAPAPGLWNDLAQGPSLVQVNLRFTAAQLLAIRQGVLNELGTTCGSNPCFSRIDVVIALLIHSLTQADENSSAIDHLSIMVNHRGMGVVHDNAACNAILWGFSDPLLQSHDMSVNQAILDITRQIRESLIRIRDLNNLSILVARQTAFMKLPASIEMGLEWESPLPGHVTVNSMWHFDWTSAHFGYPDQTRFYHTSVPVPRYVEIYTPNPTLLPDGKTWENRHGDAEVTFYVDKDIKERFEEALQSNARCLGMPGEVQFV